MPLAKALISHTGRGRGAQDTDWLALQTPGGVRFWFSKFDGNIVQLYSADESEPHEFAVLPDVAPPFADTVARAALPDEQPALHSTPPDPAVEEVAVAENVEQAKSSAAPAPALVGSSSVALAPLAFRRAHIDSQVCVSGFSTHHTRLHIQHSNSLFQHLLFCFVCFLFCFLLPKLNCFMSLNILLNRL